MGMSSYIFDCVDEFEHKAATKCGECESFGELVTFMEPHKHLLNGSAEGDDWTMFLSEIWEMYWSKHQ